MSEVRDTFDRLAQALNGVVVGQTELVRQVLVALLAGGH
ncbi:MAG: magnesium chelatase, partial [Cyanobacteria bacterium J06639_1]